MSTRTPSVQAIEVKEWPAPPALTRWPAAAAAFTRSTSSASDVGRAIRAGAQAWLPPQLVQLDRSASFMPYTVRPGAARMPGECPGGLGGRIVGSRRPRAGNNGAVKWRRTDSSHLDDQRGRSRGGLGIPIAGGGGIIGIIFLLLATVLGGGGGGGGGGVGGLRATLPNPPRHLGGRALLLPGRQRGVHRPRLLSRAGQPVRRPRRLRPGLRDRPRDGPPRPEPGGDQRGGPRSGAGRRLPGGRQPVVGPARAPGRLLRRRLGQLGERPGPGGGQRCRPRGR